MPSPAFRRRRANTTLLTLLALLAAAFASARSLAEPPSEIARKVMPSVVLVTTEDDKGEALARGSGFVVAEGVIATNLHVIRGASKAFVKVVNGQTQLEVLGIVAENKEWDLVLLAVKDLKAPPLPIGDSAALQVGDDVYAVGNPHGLEGTFSAGIVSSIRRIEGDALLQITAPISPGSSGGPIVNKDAEVVGVAVSSLQEGQNLNFAIPADELRSVIDLAGEPMPLVASSEPPADSNLVTDPVMMRIVDQLRFLANDGHAQAMYYLGIAFYRGWGVPQDYTEAVRWFQNSAQHECVDAMYDLAVLYMKGTEIALDQGQAVMWFRKAADHGKVDAMWALAIAYDNGMGVIKDQAEASRWLSKAAEGGHAEAIYVSGCRSVDDNEAVRLFRRAAEIGHVEAMVNVGIWHELGKGVNRDPREAVVWYRKAAELGNTLAMTKLGLNYLVGEGVVQDDIEAYIWFSVASALGGVPESYTPSPAELRDDVAQYFTPEVRLAAQAQAKERFEQIERTLKK